MNLRPISIAVLLTSGAAATVGCSPRAIAVRALADAVSEGGASGGPYASDDDPELVRQAVPFGLKTMESLLEREPHHVGLLASLASGYTQYTYAFVQLDAEDAELAGRLPEARAGRARARGLYLRARDYGLRGLEERHEGMAARLRAVRDAAPALGAAEKEDVPLLYWTAASWALGISTAKDRMDLVAELPAPAAMMARALALDEAWDEGAIHEFFVSYDAARGEPRQAREHLDRALALSKGKKLGPLVSYAEGVCVQAQDRAEFRRLLERVLAFDVQSAPTHRLANVLAQRRARALLAHADDLFV